MKISMMIKTQLMMMTTIKMAARQRIHLRERASVGGRLRQTRSRNDSGFRGQVVPTRSEMSHDSHHPCQKVRRKKVRPYKTNVDGALADAAASPLSAAWSSSSQIAMNRALQVSLWPVLWPRQPGQSGVCPCFCK